MCSDELCRSTEGAGEDDYREDIAGGGAGEGV